MQPPPPPPPSAAPDAAAPATQAPGLALVGPTGSGKSAVAVALAAAWGGEIVGCDSVQLVRGFDIGSAKPSAAQRQAVPHHLVDVATWDDPWDAERYRAAAVAACGAIRARRRLPIVCGGSGLYLRALRQGLAPLPAVDVALRRRLQAAETAAPGSAWAALQRLDPEGTGGLDRRNPARLLRAWEICLQTGGTLAAARQQPRRGALTPPLTVVALGWPPAALRARLAARAEAMVAAGLLGEVRALRAAGVPEHCAPMRSIGYRQAVDVLAGRAAPGGLAAAIAAAAWAYARRQRTWLRAEPAVRWLQVDDVPAAIAALLAACPPQV